MGELGTKSFSKQDHSRNFLEAWITLTFPGFRNPCCSHNFDFLISSSSSTSPFSSASVFWRKRPRKGEKINPTRKLGILSVVKKGKNLINFCSCCFSGVFLFVCLVLFFVWFFSFFPVTANPDKKFLVKVFLQEKTDPSQTMIPLSWPCPTDNVRP